MLSLNIQRDKLRFSGESLPQMEEFMYLVILFLSDGMMEGKTDQQIGALSLVMRVLVDI